MKGCDIWKEEGIRDMEGKKGGEDLGDIKRKMDGKITNRRMCRGENFLKD